MLYNNYEEYMRDVLGYTGMSNDIYQRYNNCYNMPMYQNNQYPFLNMSYQNQYKTCYPYHNSVKYQSCNNPKCYKNQNQSESCDIKNLYPEIYHIINPMVCEMCDKNNRPINEELIESMTNEIYDNVINRVDVNNIINLNIETVNIENREAENCDRFEKCSKCEKCEKCGKCEKESCIKDRLESSTNICSKEKQMENRQLGQSSHRRRRNRLLRDLIRILILNRLFRNI